MITDSIFDSFNSFQSDIFVSEEILVHSEGNKPPYDVLLQRYSEDDSIYEWRVNNYIPITKSSWNRALSVLQRIFISSKYRYEVKQEIQDYLDNNRFDGLPFELYIQQKVSKIMLEDPNAWLIWMPYGEGLTNSKKEVELHPIIVKSKHKRKEDREEIIFYDDFDKVSYLNTDGKLVDDGDVYYRITKNEIFKVYRYDDDKKQEVYKEDLIYQHNFGFIPYIILGGRWSSTNKNYVSFFDSFVKIANEAIKQFSDWQVIMANCGYPIKEMAEIDCDYSDEYGQCEQGRILTKSGDDKPCPKCNGKGFIPFTPTTTLIRRQGSSFDEYDTRDLLKYHTPPVEVIQYAEKAWKELLERAEMSLNIVHTMEAQSGVAKEIDREDMKSFLSEIANNVFINILYNSLNIIQYYRLSYIKDKSKIEPPLVNPPTSFNIKDVDELEIDYQEYLANNVDPGLIVKTYLELINKKYNSSKFENKIAKTITKYDKLFPYSLQDKQILLENGLANRRDLIKSITIQNFVRNLAETMEDTEFIDMEFENIFKKLDKMYEEYFKETESEETRDSEESQINQNAPNAPDSERISQIQNEEIDLDLELQSAETNLRNQLELV